MSRRPVPTELKILRGNPGKRPLNTDEPKPLKGVPEPLSALSDAARAHYDRLSKMLEGMGVLTLADGDALSGLAQSIADYEEATNELAKGSKVVQTERGYTKSPWYTIQKQAFDAMQRGFTDFGLTPVARTKIHAAPKDPEQNPFANLA